MRRSERRSAVLRVAVTVLAVLLVVGVIVFQTRPAWLPLLTPRNPAATFDEPDPHEEEEVTVLELSPQARKNLELTSKPVTTQGYWRTIQVPGMIVDRPGLSDRGVTSPAVGVVTQVHAFAGDTIRPGETLFTLRLFSEYLQNTQSELFKATGEIKLINEQRARIEGLARSGTIPGNRLIELDQQIRRQDGLIQAYRQDLLTRGLSPAQIEQITEGRFVSTILVVAPPPIQDDSRQDEIRPADAADVGDGEGLVYEVEELKVDLGQQVQAGQLLSVLSNHRSLFIQGHAFKREAPMLEQAAQNGWPVEVEFAEDDNDHWPPLDQVFRIRHLANTIDPNSRTFDFFIPLTNQSRAYEKDGQKFVVWRLRPGQRVRLHVPVEHFEDVIVLPAEAVVREDPESYVFRQNGNLFDRIPVHVLHQDRRHVVLANDGSVASGIYLAQGSAASLNRILKTQSAGGTGAGVHVHADGTVHAAH